MWKPGNQAFILFLPGTVYIITIYAEELMFPFTRIIIIGLIFLLSVAGVSALSISQITYTVEQDGNGTVDMDYQLNSTEKLQYDLITKVLDLKSIGKKELEKALKREVQVQSITPESVQLSVYNMATIDSGTITTPSFTYVPVESLLEPSLYWIIQKFNIDFTPHISKVVFPDGYSESFTDAETIPVIVHQLTST